MVASAPTDNSFLSWFVKLLINNMRVTFLITTSGILFYLFPLLVVFFNGIVLGFVIAYVGKPYGVPFVLLMLLPHGIFEIPAMVLAGETGVKMFWSVVTVVKSREWKRLPTTIILGYRTYVTRVAPLLLIAALIEAVLIVWVP